MISIELEYKKNKPKGILSKFVESFMYIGNPSESNKEFILFPDGRVDLIYHHKNGEDVLTELGTFVPIFRKTKGEATNYLN